MGGLHCLFSMKANLRGKCIDNTVQQPSCSEMKRELCVVSRGYLQSLDRKHVRFARSAKTGDDLAS